MAQEEKAKAYDGNFEVYAELVNRLEEVKDAILKHNYGIAIDVLYKPYPTFKVITHSKLKESENEKIRKTIYNCVKWFGFDSWFFKDVSQEECLAWIEKQEKYETIWKPTKEQIAALTHFIRSVGESGYASPYDNNTKLLYSLLADLQALENQGEQKNLAQNQEPKTENEKIRKELIDFLWKEKIFLQEAHSSVENSPKYRFVMDAIAWLEKHGEPIDKGEISDGYHTFNELYYYRMLYNAAFFNLLPKEWVHKSKRHHTGEECFGGGWFIVIAQLPTGQISNHYELKDWDLFHIQEKEIADEWDGHSPQEAAKRLHEFLLEKKCEQPTDNDIKEALLTEYEKGRADAIAEMQKSVNIDYISGIQKELLSIEDNAENINGLTESQWVAIRAAHRLLSEYITKEQNSVWSKEEKKKIDNILNVLIDYKELEPEYLWLKSIKEKVIPKTKQEWSEEDETALCDALWAVEQARTIAKDENDMGNLWYAERFLKSLKERVQLNNLTVTDEELAKAKKDAYNDALDKLEYRSSVLTFDDGWSAAIWYLKKRNAQPQTTWKPSDEQMNALLSKLPVIKGGGNKVQDILESLYNDLKKLRAE